MQSRHRPALEWLEYRVLPAGAPAAPVVEVETTRVVDIPEAGPVNVPPTLFPPELSRVLEDALLTYDPVDADTFDFAERPVLISPPVFPDPLISQIGRLKEPEMRFPASGGGGVIHYENFILPAAPPLTQPTVEQPEAEVDMEKEDQQSEEQDQKGKQGDQSEMQEADSPVETEGGEASGE